MGWVFSVVNTILSLRYVTMDFPFSLGTRDVLIWQSLLCLSSWKLSNYFKSSLWLIKLTKPKPHLVFVGKVTGNRVGKINPFQWMPLAFPQMISLLPKDNVIGHLSFHTMYPVIFSSQLQLRTPSASLGFLVVALVAVVVEIKLDPFFLPNSAWSGSMSLINGRYFNASMFVKSLSFKDFLENIPNLFKPSCSQALFLEELNCTIFLPCKAATLVEYLVSTGEGRQ